MSRVALILAAGPLLACAASDEAGGARSQAIDASPAVVIRQVYGGGSNTGASHTHDFIELFNRSDASVTLAGHSLQYASATGTGNLGATATQLTELPTITLAPGQSYLVQEAGGSVGAAIAPDLVDPTPISMSATGGKVALVRTSTSVGCNGSSSACSAAQLESIVDLVGYGNANFSETSAAPAPSNSTAVVRVLDGCQDTNDNAADFVTAAPVPRNSSEPATTCAPSGGGGEGGGAGDGGSTSGGGGIGGSTAGGGAGGAPGPGTVRIHDVQGSAHLSPLAGEIVTNVPGIVTALRNNGFYLQDPLPDASASTSEGIFVFTSSAPGVSVGDSVLVTSRVSEFRPGCSSCAPSASAYANLTTTELERPTAIVVVSSGNALPEPIRLGALGRIPPATVIDDDAVSGNAETTGSVFDPESDGLDFYESLEGMRVQVTDAVAVGPSADFTGGSREIPVVADGGAGASVRTARGGVLIQASDFNPERIHLENSLNPLPQVNVGDSFPGLITGVVDYSFGNFKVLPTAPVPAVVPGGLQPETLSLGSPAPNQLSVASFNVENLDPSDPPTKFAALGAVIADRLGAPDLIALEEVQDNSGAVNDGTVDASQTVALLVAAIGAAGGPAYEYASIDPENGRDGGEPGGNIRVGFLYRRDRGLSLVSRTGATFATANVVLSSGGAPSLKYSPGRIEPANPAFANSRKPLAAQFAFNGVPLFVVANHFNSKGGDHPLFGRFQPPQLSSEAQRLAQAQIVSNFVEQIRAVDPNAAVVVLGDLNDFEFSPPVSLLEAAGLHTLVETLPLTERYSYVYQGNSQVLDQVLVSPSLSDRLAGFDIVHLNSEFAEQLSDHDPAVARFTLGQLPLQCGSDVLTSGALAGACDAAAVGTLGTLSGSPFAGPDSGIRIDPGATYGLRLVESNTPGQFVGRFHYVVNEASPTERHVLFSGTPSLPISLRSVGGEEQLECRRYLSEPLKTSLVGEAGSLIKEGFRTSPLAPGDYVIDIGPTPSRWVRFYAAPEQRAVAFTPATSVCAAPSPSACTAGATPAPLNAPGLGAVNPPVISVDVAYGVRLRASADGILEGALAFVPPTTGSYVLSLGAPKLRAQIREEGTRAPYAWSCSGKIPSSSGCDAFKAARVLHLVAGTRYRIELNGVEDVSWVRLAISLAAP